MTRRILIEVTREDDGTFRARPLGDYKILHHHDLTCWTDSPCFTPGVALARIGEAIDVDMISDAWNAPREDLDAGDGRPILTRACKALAASGAPRFVISELEVVDFAQKVKLPREVLRRWASELEPGSVDLALRSLIADAQAFGLRYASCSPLGVRMQDGSVFFGEDGYFVDAFAPKIVGVE